jgi:hypothetical protein
MILKNCVLWEGLSSEQACDVHFVGYHISFKICMLLHKEVNLDFNEILALEIHTERCGKINLMLSNHL